MLCSLTVLFLTVLSLAGTCLYIVAGWLALDGTLDLFKAYGPVEGRGNPALDPPPEYWINPKTGNYEPINYNKRGNLVPQVFQGIQYYLIALAVFMVFNSIIFLVDSVRSKKVVNNRNYVGKRNSRTCINCTGWLAGYLVFLTLMWLVMVGFGVVPLVEWVITMQRCWDLANPNWSPGTTQGICVDLVQYGLVFFKETQDDGYGLICGPGGNYNPPHGDLKGLCDNYYPNFSLYLASFIGACITLMAMVLFAMRHVSNFVYLKVRRWERPMNHLDPHVGPTTEYGLPENSTNYGHSVYNPNYERNVLLSQPNRLPSNDDMDSYGRRSRDNEFEMKATYYEDDDRKDRRNDRKHSRSSSHLPDDQVVLPTYVRYDARPLESSKNHRRRSYDSSDTQRRREYESDYSERRSHRRKRHYGTSDSDSSPPRYSSRDRENASDRTRSTVAHKPRALKRKDKDTRSLPDVSRRSDRRGNASRESSRRDDSPSSDYYVDEDRNRHTTSRSKHRSRSKY